jgi:hypothetical protein
VVAPAVDPAGQFNGHVEGGGVEPPAVVAAHGGQEFRERAKVRKVKGGRGKGQGPRDKGQGPRAEEQERRGFLNT